MKHTINELRRAAKAAGYTVRTKRHSEFIAATLISADGIKISWSDVVAPEFAARHRAGFDVIGKFKGTVFDGGFRVVL